MQILNPGLIFKNSFRSDAEVIHWGLERYKLHIRVQSSDIDIFLAIQYASCVFGLALQS